MTDLTCIASCDQPAAITDPIALCDDHVLELAQVIFPRLVAAASLGTPTLSRTTRVLSIPSLISGGGHEPVVYFISNGNRLKIGTSENLSKRISSLSLRPGDLRLALSGNQSLEHALHLRFSAQRIGDTEWFDYTGDLARYVEAMQARAPIDAFRFLPPAAPAPGTDRRAWGGADTRRSMIFDIVADAGPDGIETRQVIRAFQGRYPHETPPHRATVITWLSEDPRIGKPAGSRSYAVLRTALDDNDDDVVQSP